MTEPRPAPDPQESAPLWQRLYDNIFLLLGAGLLVMLVVYTGWGVWELMSMPQGTLP